MEYRTLELEIRYIKGSPPQERSHLIFILHIINATSIPPISDYPILHLNFYNLVISDFLYPAFRPHNNCWNIEEIVIPSTQPQIHYQATLFHKLRTHSSCLLVVQPVDHYNTVCKALESQSLLS